MLALAAVAGCAHQAPRTAPALHPAAAQESTAAPPRVPPEADTPQGSTAAPLHAQSGADTPPVPAVAAAAPGATAAVPELPRRPRKRSESAASRKSSAPVPVSLRLLAGAIEPLHGDDPTLPDQVLYASRGKVLEASYRLCISRDGKVQSVTPVVGIQGADRDVVDTLKTWQFPKLPLVLCKLQTLRFEIP